MGQVRVSDGDFVYESTSNLAGAVCIYLHDE